jgi:uncharacterized membrane protein YkoI
MINCKAIIFALFSAVFAMSTSASAEQLGLRSAVATPEASAEHASKARLTAFKQAEFSLENAISIAESTIGGIVIDANFQISNGRPVYVVKTFLGWDHSVWDGMIDAQTGKVIGKGQAIPEDQLDQKDRSDLAGLHEWYASLAEAVVAAEYSGSGRPISASFKETNGQVFFEVTVVKNASATKIFVDAKDCHVIS